LAKPYFCKKISAMGIVYAQIELANQEDLVRFKDKRIDKKDIRRVTARMLVDSGAYMMAINDEVRAQLGFEDTLDTTAAQFADGSVITIDIVGPIEGRFENRRCTVEAMVLPGNTECLLGAIPMEYMDVLINPRKNELIVNPAHPKSRTWICLTICPRKLLLNWNRPLLIVTRTKAEPRRRKLKRCSKYG